jgi:hypothetical protein
VRRSLSKQRPFFCDGAPRSFHEYAAICANCRKIAVSLTISDQVTEWIVANPSLTGIMEGLPVHSAGTRVRIL